MTQLIIELLSYIMLYTSSQHLLYLPELLVVVIIINRVNDRLDTVKSYDSVLSRSLVGHVQCSVLDN